ncbi:hypothetical protein KKD49_00810, partial [Myxococcota bacterium]|nr:hypothetical protein [Myxococcota bacterium]
MEKLPGRFMSPKDASFSARGVSPGNRDISILSPFPAPPMAAQERGKVGERALYPALPSRAGKL